MKNVKAIWAFSWFNPCGLLELAPMVGTTLNMKGFDITITDSPKEADLLFVAGYQTTKSMKRIKQMYDQMPESRSVIVLGTCAMSGGTYWDSYNTVKRITDYIPVNVYIPGCPSRAEAVFEACEELLTI